uniref:hypothetical protein n=1 Tax=Salmonella sp. SAL4456 TaxID=3159911 RepID=UPI00397810D1
MWASVQRSHRQCDPDSATCNSGTAWAQTNPAVCTGDQQPWNLRYSPIYTNAANPAVLSHTERTVARAVNTTWSTISPCLD